MKKDAEQKSLSVECGQTFSISLESMPGSTGYSWFLSHLTKGVVLVSVDNQQHMSGTCGHMIQVFSFLAVAKGKCEIGFQLLRPWTPGALGREIAYVVEVTEAASGDALKASLGQFSTQATAGDAACMPISYYGIPPMQTAVLKYGIPPTSMKYGIDPVVRYGFPGNMRYAAPQRFQDGCAMPLYGILPNDCC